MIKAPADVAPVKYHIRFWIFWIVLSCSSRRSSRILITPGFPFPNNLFSTRSCRSSKLFTKAVKLPSCAEICICQAVSLTEVLLSRVLVLLDRRFGNILRIESLQVVQQGNISPDIETFRAFNRCDISGRNSSSAKYVHGQTQ